MTQRKAIVIDDSASSSNSDNSLRISEEDTICCVCEDGTWTDGDPIVLCDGCDLPVHKECYGNPLVNGIPEDEWLCAVCKSKKYDGDNQEIRCQLCPVKTGAFKRSTENQWVHIVCSLWVPEVFFHYPDGKEPIDITRIPTWRFDYVCDYCGTNDGSCITCKASGCKARFHVSCGLSRQILLKYKSSDISGEPDTIMSYCETHSKEIRKKPDWELDFYSNDTNNI